MRDIPLTHFEKTSVWRIIPTRFPPIDLFGDVAPADDWPLLNEFEGLTNQRLLEEVSSYGLIRPEDRVEKSNSHYILGPLTHPNPEGSRFSDGAFGAVYVGLDFETTLEEVRRQRERFLRQTPEGPQRFDMRAIIMDLDGKLHDLRGPIGESFSDETESRALARKLRDDGSYGIVFDSTARLGGYCAAVFRPPVLSNCRQERHFAFLWDGTTISEVLTYSKPMKQLTPKAAHS